MQWAVQILHRDGRSQELPAAIVMTKSWNKGRCMCVCVCVCVCEEENQEGTAEKTVSSFGANC